MIKKILNALFDKDGWIATLVDSSCWAIFLFGGGYIAFITEIKPTYKSIILILSAVALYLLCGVIKRAIFRKLGRKVPF